MFLIDSNIFLEIFLKQEKSADSKSFLKQAEINNESIYVTSFTLHSIIVILEKYKLHNEIIQFIQYLNDYANIFIHDPTITDYLEIAKKKDSWHLNFDDALHYHSVKTLGCKLVTFDKHFKKLQDLEIIEP